MIVVMQRGASKKQVADVVKRIETLGLKSHLSQGEEHTIVGVLGQTFPELQDILEGLPAVEDVVLVSRPYKLASREFHPLDTVIDINGVKGRGITTCSTGN